MNVAVNEVLTLTQACAVSDMVVGSVRQLLLQLALQWFVYSTNDTMYLVSK